ncbi:hypothetical protein Anas_09068 [Armadillidium nasatum]|uniref:NACHT domain-containing protein n=1 Tax=Armadillidium nasatum TaxID=96803 RepID=A0A5N5TH77_9CRUS|nr:hypothetical protein Anas_09068 [Armadillidium nasatum]
MSCNLKEYGKNLLIAVSQDLYYDHENSLKGSRTVEKFINSLTKKPKISIHDDIKQYKYTDKIDDSLDISNCFNIILLLHETGWEYFNKESGREIFENIKIIKNMRNGLCHKFKYESKEIETLKETLLNSVTRICRNMTKLYEECNNKRFNEINARYKSIEESYLKGITEIWQETFYEKKFHLKELIEEKGNFKHFISLCRDSLSDIYKKCYTSSRMLEEKFNFSIEDIFVAPMLKKNRNDTQSDLYIPYEKILSEKNEKKTTVPNVVIVTADAGHGKTTLCKKFTLEWCNLESNLSNNFTFLLLIEVKKATEAGVCQYLKEVLLQDSLLKLKATEEEISLFLQQLKILIIIDAYDERSREAKTLISSVLDLPSEKTIIITTRPHCLKEITEEVKKRNLLYTQYDLEGLENEKPFIENIWKHLKKNDEKFSLQLDNFLKFIKELPPDFGTLLKVPLIAFLLTYLWVSSTERGISLENLSFTTLYKQVKELQIENAIKKIISNVEEKICYPDAKEKIENFINIVAEMCYLQAKEKKPMILTSECLESLNKYLEQQGFNKDNIKIILTTIFMSNRSLRNLNVYNYEFLHKSYFDYLVAFYSSCKLMNANCKDVKSIHDLGIFNRNFEENPDSFSFFLGILAETEKLDEYMEEIGKILKEENLYGNFNILWKFLRQTLIKCSAINDHRPNKQLCRAFKNYFLKSKWELSSKDVISGLNILKHLISIDPLTELVVYFRIDKDFPTSNFEVFTSLIRQVNKKLVQNKKIVTFETYFYYDQMNKEPVFSDDLMSCIDPKHFKIEKFLGFIENDKSIKNFRSLLNLRDVELTIKNIEILQKLIEACRNKKRLRHFRLRFDDSILSKKHKKKLPTLNLNNNNVEIFVQYNVRVSQDMSQTISNLAELDSKNVGFHSVTVICDDEKEDKKFIRNWVQNIDEKIIILDKLTVKSTFGISDEFRYELENLVNFKIRWELKF